jgi:heme O synthase-like polyprenyltransferase
MLIMRFFVLLAVLGIGGSLLLWLLTGNPRYRLWAWKAFRIALVVLFVFLALFVLERVLVPLG